MNKKIILFSILALSIVAIVVYTKQRPSSTQKATQTPSATRQPSGNAASQKQGDTSKTGVITASGGVYFLTETGGSPKMIDSYSLDFADYLGQTVTVTGQYSGDTLFVSRIE